MKVVYLCDEYPPPPSGGIGIMVQALARALAARGHEVHCVGCYTRAASASEIDEGVHVWRLAAPRGRLAPVFRRIAVHRALRRIAQSGAIDVLEAPDFEGPSAFIPRCSRVRIVRLHGSHRYFADDRHAKYSSSVAFFEKRALRAADTVVSVSDYTARRTRALFKLTGEIPVIQNAVDLPPGMPRKHSYELSHHAVYFGTLAEKKGMLPLADAWRVFHADYPEWRLTLIGRDTRHNGYPITALMRERMGDAASSAQFVGVMPHERLLQALPGFDFAILPSYAEAFALAPLEAMAVGLPVIISCMSCGPEQVTDGVDGWLCDPRDAQTLVAAMRRVAADAETRMRTAQAATAKVQGELSFSRFVDRDVELYRSALRAKGRDA